MKRANSVLAAIVILAIVVVTVSLTIDVIPCDSFWSIGPSCVEILEELESQND